MYVDEMYKYMYVFPLHFITCLCVVVSVLTVVIISIQQSVCEIQAWVQF